MPLLFTLDRHNGVPAYRQLIDQIQVGIASGLLVAGEELPSTRALSRELATNPMTVSKAYNQLEHDGLLERRPGRPLVVARTAATTDAAEGDAAAEAEFKKAARTLAELARTLGFSPTRAKRLLGETLSDLDTP